MKFEFDFRNSDAPYVHMLWKTQSDEAGTFQSTAASMWEMVINRYEGDLMLTIRGAETQARIAESPPETDFFGIQFQVGTFMPLLPMSQLLDGGITLPEAGSKTFWLNGSSWEYPTFDNADTFIQRLVRQGLIISDPVVQSALADRPPTDLSPRSVQRRFLQATGMTQGTVRQIERATLALDLLQSGVSILDTVEQAGYVDQPHLTKSLKLYMGQTPAQVVRERQSKLVGLLERI